MEKVLIDTDVLIDFLRGHKVRIKDVFEKIQNKNIRGLISLASIIELYSGKDTKGKDKLTALEKLLSFFEIIYPDLSIAKLSGSIKRDYGLSLADAIIAASALKESCRLYTFNLKHYQKVPELNFYLK